MNVRERILTIRLLEKAARQPSYIQNLGLELTAPELRQEALRESRSGSIQTERGSR